MKVVIIYRSANFTQLNVSTSSNRSGYKRYITKVVRWCWFWGSETSCWIHYTRAWWGRTNDSRHAHEKYGSVVLEKCAKIDDNEVESRSVAVEHNQTGSEVSALLVYNLFSLSIFIRIGGESHLNWKLFSLQRYFYRSIPRAKRCVQIGRRNWSHTNRSKFVRN